MKKILVLAGVILLLIVSLAEAGCVEKFSWLPNSESNLAGYKIYYGFSNGGPYTEVADIGKPETINGRVYGEVSDLIEGEEYFFVCVAVNDQNVESDYCQQISVTAGSGVPGRVNNLFLD